MLHGVIALHWGSLQTIREKSENKEEQNGLSLNTMARNNNLTHTVVSLEGYKLPKMLLSGRMGKSFPKSNRNPFCCPDSKGLGERKTVTVPRDRSSELGKG